MNHAIFLPHFAGRRLLLALVLILLCAGRAVAAQAAYHPVGVADWDNDGAADVLTYDDDGDLWLSDGAPKKRFSSKVKIGANFQGFTAFGVADWDHDGYQDVLMREDRGGTLMLYPGQGVQARSTAPLVPLSFKFGSYAPVGVADWNRDGVQDIIVTDQMSGLLWAIPGNNVRAALASPPPTILLSSNWDWRRSTGFAVTDWDGDGNPDVLARDDVTGDLWLYPGNGHFAPLSTRYPLGSGWTDSTPFGTQDRNGDGHADLIARNDTSGTLYAFPGAGGTGALASQGMLMSTGWRDTTPTVVAVGDSAISGEAGRWAGNSNINPTDNVDALGTHAYDDWRGTSEAITGCHRSKSSEIGIGGGVIGVNLACSGAKTTTYYEGNGTGNFKPGLDFYAATFSPNVGQALALRRYAAAHPHQIKTVTVLIGSNDIGFSEIAQDCVTHWILSTAAAKLFCNNDNEETTRFDATHRAIYNTAVFNAYLNVHTAMQRAGYRDSEYRIIAQTYTLPIPPGAGFRYPESGYSRQDQGGCGLWDADADWVNTTVVPAFNEPTRQAVNTLVAGHITNVDLLDMTHAFDGHRLCEKTVGLLEERGIPSWTDPRAADNSEWQLQAIIRSKFGLGTGPYQFQENGHPNYWGQLALRNCFRTAYNNGTPRGGSCTPDHGLDQHGEPNMNFSGGAGTTLY